MVIEIGDSSGKERPVIRFPYVRMDRVFDYYHSYESTARQLSFSKLGPTWPEEVLPYKWSVGSPPSILDQASDLYYCCTTASSFCSLTWKRTGIIRQIQFRLFIEAIQMLRPGDIHHFNTLLSEKERHILLSYCF